jgi:hypothetical protein
MKAITVLADPKQVNEHVRALWRTDLFRRSHDDTLGFVRAIIDRFAALPRVLYDMSERISKPRTSRSGSTPSPAGLGMTTTPSAISTICTNSSTPPA